jgi:hypothetical protein
MASASQPLPAWLWYIVQWPLRHLASLLLRSWYCPSPFPKKRNNGSNPSQWLTFASPNPRAKPSPAQGYLCSIGWQTAKLQHTKSQPLHNMWVPQDQGTPTVCWGFAAGGTPTWPTLKHKKTIYQHFAEVSRRGREDYCSTNQPEVLRRGREESGSTGIHLLAKGFAAGLRGLLSKPDGVSRRGRKEPSSIFILHPDTSKLVHGMFVYFGMTHGEGKVYQRQFDSLWWNLNELISELFIYWEFDLGLIL